MKKQWVKKVQKITIEEFKALLEQDGWTYKDGFAIGGVYHREFEEVWGWCFREWTLGELKITYTEDFTFDPENIEGTFNSNDYADFDTWEVEGIDVFDEGMKHDGFHLQDYLEAPWLSFNEIDHDYIKELLIEESQNNG